MKAMKVGELQRFVHEWVRNGGNASAAARRVRGWLKWGSDRVVGTRFLKQARLHPAFERWRAEALAAQAAGSGPASPSADGVLRTDSGATPDLMTDSGVTHDRLMSGDVAETGAYGPPTDELNPLVLQKQHAAAAAWGAAHAVEVKPVPAPPRTVEQNRRDIRSGDFWAAIRGNGLGRLGRAQLRRINRQRRRGPRREGLIWTYVSKPPKPVKSYAERVHGW